MSFFSASLFHCFHVASCLAIEHFSDRFGNTEFAFCPHRNTQTHLRVKVSISSRLTVINMFYISMLFCYICIISDIIVYGVAISVVLTPVRRRGETLMLSEDESIQFWKQLELVTEDIREFFKHTYDLHVESFHDEKLICNVFSLSAFDTFWNDFKNDSARVKFEKALDFHEPDISILLDIPAVACYKAKEFFSRTDAAEPQQM